MPSRSITGVEFDEAWGDRVDASLDSLPVSFIGLKSLLRNKRATGRTRDLDDAEKLAP